MRVLVATNMYPSEHAKHHGLFVQREIMALNEFEPDLDIRVTHIDTIARTSRYVTGVLDMARAVREFNPDVVHCHYGLTQSTCAAWSGPLVCTFHGSDLNVAWQRAISVSLARRLDHCIVVHEGMRRYLPPSIPVTVGACGVDAGFRGIDKNVARESLGIAPDVTVILFPADPRRPVKRYDRFKETVALLNGAPRTLVLSDVEPHKVSQYLSAADCVLLTSDAEGSPVVTKEAMVCGTRVVSTDCGDVRSQVRGMSGCFVSREGSPAELASLVARSLESPPPDSSIAQERFSVKHSARIVADVYRSVTRCA